MGKIEKKKISTGILIVPPIILLIVFTPPFILTLMVLGATYLGLREFYDLALPQSSWIEKLMSIGLGVFLSLMVSYGNMKLTSPFLVLILLLLSILFMATSQDLSSTITHIGVSFLGICYIGFLLAHVVLIRQMGDGRQWVLFLVTTVWAGDISALLCGSLIGRYKLYPKISPNKTYEGLFGAIIGSIIMALAFSNIFLPHMKKGLIILLGIGMGIFGQFGDFTESMLKRSARVKDSGSLIPGHGGMLDRLDSFLFSAPYLHYFLYYIFKETP